MSILKLNWSKTKHNKTGHNPQAGRGDFQRGCQVGHSSAKRQTRVWLPYGPAPESHDCDSRGAGAHSSSGGLRRHFAKKQRRQEGASGRKPAGRCLNEFHWNVIKVEGEQMQRKKPAPIQTEGSWDSNGVFQQGEQRCINKWVWKRKYLLGQFHANSTKTCALSDCVDKLLEYIHEQVHPWDMTTSNHVWQLLRVKYNLCPTPGSHQRLWTRH